MEHRFLWVSKDKMVMIASGSGIKQDTFHSTFSRTISFHFLLFFFPHMYCLTEVFKCRELSFAFIDRVGTLGAVEVSRPEAPGVCVKNAHLWAPPLTLGFRNHR